MDEQGRAAVLGWRQTVDAAWSQQQAALAGQAPPGVSIEVLRAPPVGFRTAGWYWNSRDLNRFADAGDFREITRRTNGGYNGMAERERYYAKAKEALGI